MRRGLNFLSGRKGSLLVGNDADLMMLDPSRSYTLDSERLLQRHKMSPYIGSEFTGTIVRTVRRGETIFAEGKIMAETRGKFVQPGRSVRLQPDRGNHV